MDSLYWGKDPLYWTSVRMFIKDIHRLTLDENSMCHHYLCDLHPISRVYIVGNIVAKTEKFSHTMYTVDDGTETISCTLWTRNKDGTRKSMQTLVPCKRDPELGDLAKVVGKLRIPRFQQTMPKPTTENTAVTHNEYILREIVIETMQIVEDRYEELFFWLDCVKLWETRYSKPSILPISTPSDSSLFKLQNVIIRDVRILKADLFESCITEDERSKAVFQATLFSKGEISRLKNVEEFIRNNSGASLDIALARLVKNGFFYELKKAKFPSKDYALITHATTLSPMIITVLSRNISNEGMWKSQIAKRIRTDPICRNIPESRIERSLALLVRDKYLIEVSNERYKLNETKVKITDIHRMQQNLCFPPQ